MRAEQNPASNFKTESSTPVTVTPGITESGTFFRLVIELKRPRDAATSDPLWGKWSRGGGCG